MSHRFDLTREGFVGYKFGPKKHLRNIGVSGKRNGWIKRFRVVPSGPTYELYIKKK